MSNQINNKTLTICKKIDDNFNNNRNAGVEWILNYGIWIVLAYFVLLLIYKIITQSYKYNYHYANKSFKKWIKELNITSVNSCDVNVGTPIYNPDGSLASNKLLCNFYVASSYKSYLVGGENGWVSKDAISQILKCGARLIDIDIFNNPGWGEDAEPYVANGKEKGQYIYSKNKIHFKEICETILDGAFSGTTDPLFLNLRLNVENNFYTLDRVADILTEVFDDRLLSKKYSYQRSIIGLANIDDLKGKIVIFADKYFKNSRLDEFVNYSPQSNFMRYLTRDELVNSHDFNEQVDFNRRWITIVFNDDDEKNYDPWSSWVYGCQFYCINYKYKDDHMQSYIERFKESSFVFKPYKLLYHPPTIKEPPPQDPKLSFANINVETPFYSMKI